MRSVALPRLGAAMLILVWVSVSAAQTNPEDDAGRTAEDAATLALEAAERIEDRRRTMYRRIDLCREAIESDDWPAYVGVKVDAEPELGPKLDAYEVCVIYLHGRSDQLIRELQGMKRE